MPGRYRNWYATSFAGTPVDGVKRVTVDSGIQVAYVLADGDAGPSVALVSAQAPTLTVSTINAVSLALSAGSTRGEFTTTLLDSYFGATPGGGAVSFTTNALSFIAARATAGDFNQLAAAEFTVGTVWLDGVTSPVTVSAY